MATVTIPCNEAAFVFNSSTLSKNLTFNMPGFATFGGHFVVTYTISNGPYTFKPKIVTTATGNSLSTPPYNQSNLNATTTGSPATATMDWLLFDQIVGIGVSGVLHTNLQVIFPNPTGTQAVNVSLVQLVLQTSALTATPGTPGSTLQAGSASVFADGDANPATTVSTTTSLPATVVGDTFGAAHLDLAFTVPTPSTTHFPFWLKNSQLTLSGTWTPLYPRGTVEVTDPAQWGMEVFLVTGDDAGSGGGVLIPTLYGGVVTVHSAVVDGTSTFTFNGSGGTISPLVVQTSTGGGIGTSYPGINAALANGIAYKAKITVTAFPSGVNSGTLSITAATLTLHACVEATRGLSFVNFGSGANWPPQARVAYNYAVSGGTVKDFCFGVAATINRTSANAGPWGSAELGPLQFTSGAQSALLTGIYAGFYTTISSALTITAIDSGGGSVLNVASPACWACLVQQAVLASLSIAADTFDGSINVAWVSGGPPGMLKQAVHLSPQKNIGSSTVGWETTQVIESSTDVSNCGLVYLPEGRLYLNYNKAGSSLQRTNDQRGSGLVASWSTSAAADSDHISAGGMGQEQAWRYLAGVGTSSLPILFSQCRDGKGTAWTTGITAISGKGPLCGGVWMGNIYGLVYTRFSDGETLFITTDTPASWSGTPIDTGFTGNVCGAAIHPSGRIVALLQVLSSTSCTIIYSNDLGGHWIQVSLAITPAIPPKIVCAGDVLYVVYIQTDAPHFLASTDGGLTWT